MGDYFKLVSASALKDNVDSKCKRLPVLRHINQEKIAEMHKTRDFHSPTRGEKFHERYFNAFRKGLKKRAEHDMVAFQLLNLRRNTKHSTINPLILSEAFHVVGTPDFYLEKIDSVRVVELKDRHSSTFSKSDELQLGAYLTILRDPWFRSKPELHCKGKEVKGYVLFKDGVLKNVNFNDKDLIKTKALEILEMVDDYKVNNRLPKSEACNLHCENIDYCSQIGGVMTYENTFTSPGRLESQSPAYLARV